MNASEYYRFLLFYWIRVLGFDFPRLCKKIRRTLDDPNATEADYAELIGEVNNSGGPILGTPSDQLSGINSATTTKEMGRKVSEEELTSEFRYEAKPDGKPMMMPFVGVQYGLTTSNLTRDYAKYITDRVRVGRNHCWKYCDILVVCEVRKPKRKRKRQSLRK